MSAFTSVDARRAFGMQAYNPNMHQYPPPPPPPPPTLTTMIPPPGHAFPPLPPPPPPPPSAPKKVVWPQAAREYVQRSADPDNAIPGISFEDAQVKLKQILTEAAERDSLYTIDWASFPLPQAILQEERSHTSYVPQPSPWQATFASLRMKDNANTDANVSKKRAFDQSNDDGSAGDDAAPPWRKTATSNAFEDRITYSTKAQEKKAEKQKRKAEKARADLVPDNSKSAFDLEKRRQRFEGAGNVQTSNKRRMITPEPIGPVVGTCEDLEKSYFRLTSAPKPETVRPLPVLRKTLALLKKKWKQENNYGYLCDQLKSLRQDLTVQRIKNDFTVEVYELHARIALEKADLGEYNQCQTQLRALYRQNLGGHPAEFLAYRILYFIYTCNRTNMNDVLADLTLTDRRSPEVKHALAVRSALAMGNYHRFFKLFQETPNMGAYLIDMFLTRERLAALASICKTYKPETSLRFLSDELGFESDQECCSFVCDHGGSALFEQKETMITFAAGKGALIFEAAKSEAFRRVDIKGQI